MCAQSELYDIVSNGLLASQTRGTTCTDIECLTTRFLCLYADIMIDLNPIAKLLGDSEEAIAIKSLPTHTECDCLYSYDMIPTCTCGIAEATKILSTQRSKAVWTYIRTHKSCRD
jgi:hypothetical protein